MANSPPSPRESSFPSTSIGRSAGSKLLSASANQHRPLSRESSRESLNAIAHPLLSPSSTATSFSNAIGSNSTGATASSVTTWDNGFSSSNLGYVPYTRPSRHRPTPTPPTHSGTHPPHAGPTSPSVIVTPATTSSSSSSATHVDLTAKLQLMSLKAAAQALGIETGTVGWIILEALAREHGAEWDTIWEALDTGKAILLLPSEPLATLKAKSNLSVVSPAFIRNHVLYTESDGKTLERAVSLSGLRGIFQEEEGQMLITFTSTLHPHSSTFHDISSPGTRAKGFASLMPQFPSSSNYTSFSLPTMTPALSLPPRRSTSLPPPLPPRRNQHQGGSVKPSTSTSDGRGGSGNSSSRFSGLASLFGRSHPSSSSSTTNPNSSSPAGSRPPSIVLSDSASAMSSEEASIKDQGEFTATSSSSSILVPTYVVSTSILEQEVLEGMWKGIVGDLERILRFSSLLDSDPSSISHIAFPLSLPNILISFLESANALPVLRITAPHPRITGSKSKAITRRLISGSGSVPAHREASQERREGKETSELEHQRSLDISHTSSHAHTDSVYYVYEVNPYGIKEGWGSAAGAGSDNSDAENRKEAETGAMEAIEDLSARWQSVYREVEDLVEEWAEAEFAETETSTRDESKGAEKEGSAVEEKEQRKREILERTERALCCAGGIYERLSPAPSPCTSWTTNISIATPATDTDESNILESTEIITDSTHDSALASRIAALVMIDFGLQDLDLDVGPETQDDDEKLKMEEEIMTILQACGNEICGIEKVFTPKEKADAMVRAHRVLVGEWSLQAALHDKFEGAWTQV
ncbi:hypothetical protein GYMLUDRAFT_576645 [Collybiopsis luxurians FD-317 M1]|uniref:Unplaced genomic scaffold GYMLUscaffold_22, whole genome shotgun sequence n=1 Tax=Collybiopsis luxurians FD-317 M1 TaxID=944289 RepID=A0A0D0CGK0_9AGAR|nr:hypothetical protein GYMLUDRAFT_576645 [Collybiopsis luxurians FD-317 M1]